MKEHQLPEKKKVKNKFKKILLLFVAVFMPFGLLFISVYYLSGRKKDKKLNK